MKNIQRLICATLLPTSIILLTIGTPGIPVAQPAGAPGNSTTSQEQARYKAIWEPVNYKEDLEFTDVFFVNDKVGWVSGDAGGGLKGGVILHTQDGGDNWTIQLGDPQSSQRAYRELRSKDSLQICEICFQICEICG
jgi:hypothetical protein